MDSTVTLCCLCHSKPLLAVVNDRGEEKNESAGGEKWIIGFDSPPTSKKPVCDGAAGLLVPGNTFVSTGMRAAYYTGSSTEWQLQRWRF